uniref:Uncharacterized protein n=1 Tax=Anguilla anguilla TaxID=7936 RepID=A0A0E9W4N6_ANGAN
MEGPGKRRTSCHGYLFCDCLIPNTAFPYPLGFVC